MNNADATLNSTNDKPKTKKRRFYMSDTERALARMLADTLEDYGRVEPKGSVRGRTMRKAAAFIRLLRMRAKP